MRVVSGRLSHPNSLLVLSIACGRLQVFEDHCKAMKAHLERRAAAARDVNAAVKSDNEAIKALGGAVQNLSAVHDRKIDLLLELQVVLAQGQDAGRRGGYGGGGGGGLPDWLLQKVRDELSPEAAEWAGQQLGRSAGDGGGRDGGEGSGARPGRPASAAAAAGGAAAQPHQHGIYVPSLLSNFDGEVGVIGLWCARSLCDSLGVLSCVFCRHFSPTSPLVPFSLRVLVLSAGRSGRRARHTSRREGAAR